MNKALSTLVMASFLAFAAVITPAQGDTGKELYDAVLFQDLPQLETLLQGGADPNYKEHNRSLLAWAAQGGSVGVVKILLEAGADPNVADGVGHTPLMRAIETLQPEIIAVLLAADSDTSIATSEGKTAAMLAVETGDATIVQVLAAAGADFNAKDASGNTVLMHAVSYSVENLPAIIAVLGETGTDMNAGSDYFTPLFYAVEQGDEALVGALLEAGADPDVKAGEGNAPLLASFSYPEIARRLLDAGADPNISNRWGESALFTAIENGTVEEVKMLIEAGADVNLKNDNGQTPLQRADSLVREEMMALLKAHGATESAAAVGADTAAAVTANATQVETTTTPAVSAENEPFEIPDLEGGEPHVIMMAAVAALRANDLDALVRIAGGEQMYSQLKMEWAQKPVNAITEKDRAEFAALQEMFASTAAEEQLMARLEPQLAELKGQMDVLIEQGQGMASAMLGQSPALEDDGKQKIQGVLDSVVTWLSETDIASPQRARQAIGIAGNLVRQLDVSTLEAMAELKFAEVLNKGGMVLAGVKQMLSVYDLSVDGILDSFEAVTLSNDGQKATVSTKIVIFDHPYETETEFVWTEGQWKPEEALTTLGSMMATAPEDAQTLPSGILQNIFDDMEVAVTYRDEDGFRTYWHPLGYAQNLVGDSGQSGADVFAEGSSEGWTLKPDTAGVIAHAEGFIVPSQVWSLQQNTALDNVYALMVMHEGAWVLLGAGEDLQDVESLALRFPFLVANADQAQSSAVPEAESPTEEGVEAEVAGSRVDLVGAEVMAFEQMAVEADSASPVGLSQVLRIPDRDLLVVWMTWDVEWDEQNSDITIEADGVRLLDEQGTEFEPIGTLEARALFRSYLSNLWIHRPLNWEDAPRQRYHWNAVFAVPRATKSFTLKAGAHERDIVVELPAEPVYDPSWMATVEILNVGFVDEIKSSVYAANQEIATIVRPLSNKMIAVTLAVTPNAGNTETREQFSWGTNWLGLITQSGLYAPAVGESDAYGGFSIAVGHTVDKESGAWGTVTTTAHFVVPEDTTSFDLTMLASPVASGSVPGMPPSSKPDQAADQASVDPGASSSASDPAITEAATTVEAGSVVASMPAVDEQTDEIATTPMSSSSGQTESEAANTEAGQVAEQEQAALVKAIQVRLAELGYAPGPADGIAGKGTRQAALDYQQIAGIGADGKLTVDLLEHMQSDAAVVNPGSVLPWGADSTPVVAVAAFDNSSDATWWTAEAGEALADLFGLDLASEGRLDFAERTAVDAVIDGRNPAGGLSTGLRRQLHAEAGADFLLVGTVTEFMQEKGGLSVAGFGIGEKEARISLQLHLLNVATGKVVRSREIVETSANAGRRLGIYKAGFEGVLKKERQTAVGKSIRAAVARAGDYLECAILTSDPCS